MKKSKVAIILLNWNGKDDTIECLHSLKDLSYPSYQPIVVDNGSFDDSVSSIRKQFPEVPILQTGKNLGFAEGNNVAIRWAMEHKADWILLLNNDTIVSKDLIENLLEAAKDRPKGGIFGAKILKYHQPDTIDHLGGVWSPEKAEFFSLHSGEKDRGFFEMQKVDYVCGAALFVHRSVFEKVGLLEPKFFLLWEESDFCSRAKKQGFEIWTAPKAAIWHKVSSSFSGGKPHMHYFWWRNRLLYIERNLSEEEKKRLYKTLLYPELKKLFRRAFLRLLSRTFAPSPKRALAFRRLRAGCRGVLDYYISQFGNGPKWIAKK